MMYSRISTISQKEGFICITFKKSVTVGYPDILEIYQLIKAEYKDEPLLKLVDMSAVDLKFTPEALNCLWSKNTKKNTAAIALVLLDKNSQQDKFDLDIRKIPFEIFENYFSAAEWLLKQ